MLNIFSSGQNSWITKFRVDNKKGGFTGLTMFLFSRTGKILDNVTTNHALVCKNHLAGNLKHKKYLKT